MQITVDGRTYEVEVELVDEEEAPALSALPAPAAPAPTPAPSAAADAKVCRSPAMGLVIKVNVQPGQRVEAGELLLVLEAMKMETNVTASAAATVKSVLVKPGDPVKLNQELVEFE